MSQSISPQHPAVVLRSHYVHLRAMLAVAMVAVACLTASVVILATNDSGNTGVSSASSATPAAATGAGQRYDGGPEEGTSGPNAAARSASTRYDGGPEEGTTGASRFGGAR